jgi:hypothetical protein
MAFSAFQLRFAQLLLVVLGVAFILFQLRSLTHKTTDPTQLIGSEHWDNFDDIRNETLGVIPLQASSGDLSAHVYLG